MKKQRGKKERKKNQKNKQKTIQIGPSQHAVPSGDKRFLCRLGGKCNIPKFWNAKNHKKLKLFDKDRKLLRFF